MTYNDKMVCWTSYNVFGPGGYAEEGRNFTLALDDAGVSVGIESLDFTSEQLDLGSEVTKKLRSFQKKIPASAPKIHHVFPHHFHPENGRVNIVRTMLESDNIPPFWVDALNQADEVWVPSKFNKKTFTRSGVEEEKIRVIHSPLPPLFQKIKNKTFHLKNNKKFRFLSIFRDWIYRKGWDILLKSYVEEFGPEEGVVLVLKTGPFAGPERLDAASFLKKYIHETLAVKPDKVPEIELISHELPLKELPGLYSACNCFVLPSRGEGWGRPYMEAMATGLPVIGTGWGGNTEFMNNQNSYLLGASLKHIPEKAWLESYCLAGKWAEPSVSELRSLLRKVFKNQEEAKQKAAQAKKDVWKLCNSQKVAHEIQLHLNRLSKKPQEKKSFSKRPTSGYLISLSTSSESQVKIIETVTLSKVLDLLKKKRVKTLIVYGTGKAARQVSEYLLEAGIDIIYFVDQNGENIFLERKVIRLKEISLENFNGADMVLLAAYPAVYKQVQKKLLEINCRLPLFPLVMFYDF